MAESTVEQTWVITPGRTVLLGPGSVPAEQLTLTLRMNRPLTQDELARLSGGVVEAIEGFVANVKPLPEVVKP